jgi:hypothetical protein
MRSAAVLAVVSGWALHTRLSNPRKPPWRLLGGLLIGSWYCWPSSVNRPLAMRLP